MPVYRLFLKIYFLALAKTYINESINGSRFIFIRHSHGDSDSCADDGTIGLRF